MLTLLLAFIRAAHFGASLLPLSVFATLRLVVNPAAAAMAGTAANPAAERFRRQIRWLLGVCFVVAAGSGFLWLWIALAGMSGTPLRQSLDADLFKIVLTQTPPGHVWMLRAAGALPLAAAGMLATYGGRGFKSAPSTLGFCIVAGAWFAGSLAWLGHAGAGVGLSARVHLAADVLHLLSAAVWPGGLLPFVLFLRLLLKTREPALAAIACAATRRFSSVNLVAAGLLAVSGGVNSYFLAGNIDALFSTEYGRLLLFKVGLFILMISIGAVNLLRLVPRLSVSGAEEKAGPDGSALDRIIRNVWIEIWLGTLVLAVVGILGITPPAFPS